MITLVAVALGALSLFLTIATAVVISLVSGEARGAVPDVCQRILDRTALQLPPHLRDRREEWEQELYEAKDRPLSQVAIALRIWRDGRGLAREAMSGVAEGGAPRGNRGVPGAAIVVRMITLVEGGFTSGARRLGRIADFAVVLGLAVGMIAGVVSIFVSLPSVIRFASTYVGVLPVAGVSVASVVAFVVMVRRRR